MADMYTSPEYKKSALLITDMQKDFVLEDAVCEIQGSEAVIPNIVKLLKKFREAKKPIIYTIRIYKKDGSNVDACRRNRVEQGLEVAAPDSSGAGLVDELKLGKRRLEFDRLILGEILEIGPNEYIMYKSRWGAFYKTDLENFLREKGITTLIFTGCNFPNCPRTSIYEASERDFRIVVVEDAISQIYEKGIGELRDIGCEIMLADKLARKI